MPPIHGGPVGPPRSVPSTAYRPHQPPTLQSPSSLLGARIAGINQPPGLTLSLRPPTAVLLEEAVRAPQANEFESKHAQNGSGPPSGRLLHHRTAFEEEHRIRAYECGPDQKTTIFTISNLLQVSSMHKRSPCKAAAVQVAVRI